MRNYSVSQIFFSDERLSVGIVGAEEFNIVKLELLIHHLHHFIQTYTHSGLINYLCASLILCKEFI